MRNTIAGLLFVILVLGTNCAGAATGATGMRSKPKRYTHSGRFVAEIPLNSRTSIGLNYQTYLFEFDGPVEGDASRLVKISYRFALRDPEIPSAFLDYSRLHTFRMVRDESCDESADAMITSYRFDRNGNFQRVEDSVVFSGHAPAIRIGDRAVLPCYIVTPNDYRSTKATLSHVQRELPPTRSEEAR